MDKIHSLLSRQLDKFKLSPDECPTSKKTWQNFLAAVSRAYGDADQDRYLLERSMEVSSRELTELNQKLEKAQHIARMGHWFFNAETDYAVWSKELFNILHVDHSSGPLTYEGFMKRVHVDDRTELMATIDGSLENKKDFSHEFRLVQPDGSYRWYEAIGQHEGKDNQLSGVIIDIHMHKESEATIRKLNQQLLTTARQAGMTEVATSMLHNIGNVLNSTNVSITVIKEKLRKTTLTKLSRVNAMLQDHKDDLTSFLASDPKGKLIPAYLQELDRKLWEENEKHQQEVNQAEKHLSHIKDIVHMQQIIGGSSSVVENISMYELVDTAIEMTMQGTAIKHISLHKYYESCPPVSTDKSRVLQILVNLLQNAREAVSDQKAADYKVIDVTLAKQDKKNITISINDSGIGIPKENLDKLFNFGFTTKEAGNGFGLHGAALSAKDLGGELTAESKGSGLGSVFTLVLPIQYEPRG